jgi:hypothetical protein
MRILSIVLLAVIPAAAQSPLVRLYNASHPVSRDFQVGDRFEILLTGLPNQPVSVRTTRAGRTDWGPIIGSTDSTGRWSAVGQFEKSGLGDWGEVWTVGYKVASPAIQFSVNAPPCLPGGQSFQSQFGIQTALTCETAEGRQTFTTPSSSDSFRTPDGRLVPGDSTEQTQDGYQMAILQYFITGQGQMKTPIALQSSRGGRGDETADLITKLIGVNALRVCNKITFPI